MASSAASKADVTVSPPSYEKRQSPRRPSSLRARSVRVRVSPAMLRCGVARSALPQQPPCQRRAPRHPAPPPRRFTRRTPPWCRAAPRSRACAPPLRAAADDDAGSSPLPPPPPPAAPLWAVPWDDGVSATVCARFAFLWCAIGFAGPSLVQQLAGAPLSADARAEAQLALELLKCGAVYQLARAPCARCAAAPKKRHADTLRFTAIVATRAFCAAAAAVVCLPPRGASAGAGRGGRARRSRRCARSLRRRGCPSSAAFPR